MPEHISIALVLAVEGNLTAVSGWSQASTEPAMFC